MLPLVNVDQRQQFVCSADPAVTLTLLPQSDEDKEKGSPPVRADRKPVRWLRPDEVELIGAGALVVIVRLMNRDEQFQVTGGLASLNAAGIGRANHHALTLCVVSASGQGVDVRTPKELAEFLQRLPLRYADPLGDRIVDDSCGFNDPFVSSV